MKISKTNLVIIGAYTSTMVMVLGFAGWMTQDTVQPAQAAATMTPKGCVFKTTFEGEFIDSAFMYKTPQKVMTSVASGLEWIAKAQHNDGGWGAGSHYNQGEMNPHAVKPDPATSAMVAMALLRSGSTLTTGPYSTQLSKGLEYLLEQVESSKKESSTITDLTGTQIQTKLGANIDVVMTSQFLSNILEYVTDNEALKRRVKDCLQTCVNKIQSSQNSNGSFKSSGWAGVLQSSFANNALEVAQTQGIQVDTAVLDKSREFQKSNFNAATGDVNTEMGAGVVLYSVSSSTRASAKGARKVDEDFKKAKDSGRVAKDAKVTAENLMQLGYAQEEAKKLANSYEVYNTAKTVSQSNNVTKGFGNNGGEEFLSFLQTGESMIIGKDTDWKKWYDNVSGTLLSIQNSDGSWSGHHCITSPVFCTATSVLILTVNNDVDKLVAMGGK